MRAVLWCNGDIPSTVVIERVTLGNAVLFGVDGGADKARSLGYTVSEVIGDLDSVDTDSWSGSMNNISDEDNSDLSKSLEVVIGRGFDEIDVIGVEGGSFGHQLGVIGSLAETSGGSKVRLHHESGVTHRYHPSMGTMEMMVDRGVSFSVFALTGCESVSLGGSKWELDCVPLDLSTRGLSNEGTGEVVNISADGTLALFVEA
ncbi:MAG: thiamine diphosphokinase [Candidatus Thermoplasmatota archaeon]|jgi:thiamine pyrophosphokinase|nr:thiamine diphosphokinase [Candidatus Thermoplasmatota archaeon]MED5273457.1 thiamine diphosphokinase [Candidatus Thermoplasmatota archaeon]